MDPRAPYLLQKYFTLKREIIETIYENIMLENLRLLVFLKIVESQSTELIDFQISENLKS